MDPSILTQNELILVLIALWSLPWKGVALWKAAKVRDKWWFIAIFILNTLAILDILYIYWISKRKSLSEKVAEEAGGAQYENVAEESENGANPSLDRFWRYENGENAGEFDALPKQIEKKDKTKKKRQARRRSRG